MKVLIHRPHSAAGAAQPGDELLHRGAGGEDAGGGNLHGAGEGAGGRSVLRASAVAVVRRREPVLRCGELRAGEGVPLAVGGGGGGGVCAGEAPGDDHRPVGGGAAREAVQRSVGEDRAGAG